MRADNRVVELGLANSREKARALIMAGQVMMDGRRVEKPGAPVGDDAQMEIIGETLPYVSRGGLKLKKAVDDFRLCLSGVFAADIGASTGGFTDCMLQEGAHHVCAVDVGYGQFDWRLRNDERVTLMERTNARYMEPAWFPSPLDFAAIDVSFISIRLILPGLYACLREGGCVVALIKPQFEAGRLEVGKKGVVRDKAAHEGACIAVLACALKLGFDVCGLSFSPVTGPKGNIEFLALFEKNGGGQGENRLELPLEEAITEAVRAAHDALRPR